MELIAYCGFDNKKEFTMASLYCLSLSSKVAFLTQNPQYLSLVDNVYCKQESSFNVMADSITFNFIADSYNGYNLSLYKDYDYVIVDVIHDTDLVCDKYVIFDTPDFYRDFLYDQNILNVPILIADGLVAEAGETKVKIGPSSRYLYDIATNKILGLPAKPQQMLAGMSGIFDYFNLKADKTLLQRSNIKNRVKSGSDIEKNYKRALDSKEAVIRGKATESKSKSKRKSRSKLIGKGR